MPSGTQINTDSDTIAYSGDLAPLFTNEVDPIYPSTVAVSFGNKLISQFMTESVLPSSTLSETEIKALVCKVTDLYISKINILNGINPEAKFILVVPPYYAVPNTTFIRVLELQKRINTEVIQQLIQQLKLIQQLPENILDRVIIADMTSSINPFDSDNYASNLRELSNNAAEKVKRALNHVMVNQVIQPGKVYSFYPDFLAKESYTPILNEDFIETSVQDWEISNPYDLKAGYTYKELKFYKRHNLGRNNFDYKHYFYDFYNYIIRNHDSIRQPAEEVYERGQALLESLKSPEELKSWKMSMGLALDVLQNPTDIKRINMLRNNAMHRAINKTDAGKHFVAALITLAGCAILALTAITMPLALTVGTVGLAVAGSLFCATGLTLFYKNKPFSSNLINLANETEKSLQVRA